MDKRLKESDDLLMHPVSLDFADERDVLDAMSYERSRWQFIAARNRLLASAHAGQQVGSDDKRWNTPLQSWVRAIYGDEEPAIGRMPFRVPVHVDMGGFSAKNRSQRLQHALLPVVEPSPHDVLAMSALAAQSLVSVVRGDGEFRSDGDYSVASPNWAKITVAHTAARALQHIQDGVGSLAAFNAGG